MVKEAYDKWYDLGAIEVIGNIDGDRKTRLLVAHLHLSCPDFEDSYQICLYILTAWHSAL